MMVTRNPSPATFPMTELIDCGLWAALTPAARAVFGVIWEFHRRYPDACHPSRTTLARAAGVSAPTVTRVVKELERTGLLRVIPASGPGANTYRLDWSEIKLPARRPAAAKGGTPYARPGGEISVTLTQDAHGRDRVIRDRRGHGHHLPDGCYVRSAAEVTIHSFLVDWLVPHWANVSYRELGVRGMHPDATVDFVVAPNVLIEHFGLPRLQSQAAKYQRNRRLKEQAIARAGWHLIALEPGIGLTEDHFQVISDAWAGASVPDALKLKERIERAGLWRPGHPSCVRLDLHVKDALGRQAGTAPVRQPRGLWEHGVGANGLPVLRRVEPSLVLAAVPPAVGSTARSGIVNVQAMTPPSPESMTDKPVQSVADGVDEDTGLTADETERLRGELAQLREQKAALEEQMDQVDRGDSEYPDLANKYYDLVSQEVELESKLNPPYGY